MYLDVIVNPFIRAVDKIPAWWYVAGVLLVVGILQLIKYFKKK